MPYFKQPTNSIFRRYDHMFISVKILKRQSFFLNMKLSFLAKFLFNFLNSFWLSPVSHDYKQYKSAINGAQCVPTAMPTVCWKNPSAELNKNVFIRKSSKSMMLLSKYLWSDSEWYLTIWLQATECDIHLPSFANLIENTLLDNISHPRFKLSMTWVLSHFFQLFSSDISKKKHHNTDYWNVLKALHWSSWQF